METNIENRTEQKLTVPGAIVVAGVIIALAVIYTGGKGSNASIAPPGPTPDLAAQKKQQQEAMADNIKPVSADDHILGNPNAPVKIVEFSDIECPFCKRFHPTLHQIIDEYGKDGKVAWVYRHFPLQMHPKATPEAEATECAWAEGGNAVFWDYLDALFEKSLTNNQTDPAVPGQVAAELGLDMAAFSGCVNNRVYQSKVEAHIQDGLNAGVSGTPYSVVISANGNKYPINGALPYESVKAIIELALKDSQ